MIALTALIRKLLPYFSLSHDLRTSVSAHRNGSLCATLRGSLPAPDSRLPSVKMRLELPASAATEFAAAGSTPWAVDRRDFQKLRFDSGSTYDGSVTLYIGSVRVA
jgi:hypothetical protein